MDMNILSKLFSFRILNFTPDISVTTKQLNFAPEKPSEPKIKDQKVKFAKCSVRIDFTVRTGFVVRWEFRGKRAKDSISSKV